MTRFPKNEHFRSSIRGYALAILVSVIAGVISRRIGPFFGNIAFYEFFHMGIVVTAFYGGLGPGLLAATTSFFILDYFVIPPLDIWILGPHLFRLVLFWIIAVLTSFLSGQLKRSKRALEIVNDELEDRVQRRTEELSEANQNLLKEISQRKEAEKTILDVSAREQRRLGQDLHDGVCQTIAGVRLMVEDMQEKAGTTSGDLEKIDAQLTEALDAAYTIARGSYPVELETNGLMAALEEMSAKISKVHPVTCRFRCRRPVAMHDNAKATHLYRMAQEAVINGIKSGKARRIRINLANRGSKIVLRITDDGIGLGNAPLKKGMGLKIMGHRAQMIGASLAFRSRKKGATMVICSLPIDIRKKENLNA